MICPNCGRQLEEQWKACPGCGADLRQQAQGTGDTGWLPVQPGVTAPPPPGSATQSPTAPATPQYQQPQGPTAAMPPVQYGQPGGYQQYRQPGGGPAQAAYPTRAQYPSAYPGQAYGQPQALGYAPGYQARPGGSVLLGLLTMVAAGIAMGSTFLPWVTASAAAGIGGSATGWLLMRAGFALGGGGFNVVLTSEGAVFFTGFFSLLLGALILLASFIIMFRRRPGGVLAMLFALAAAAVSAIDIAMVFAKLDGAAPGAGLWMFAGASVLALALGIASLSSSS